MTVRTIAGTVVRESTALAVAAVRHPVGTAAGAVGLARGAARGAASIGLHLLQGQRPGAPDEGARRAVPDPAAPAPSGSTGEPDPGTGTDTGAEFRANLPGPDLFEPPPTDPADLPEPVVIEAGDEAGEAVHTEPKPSSRSSAHGGLAGDREEVEGYVEEIPPPEEQSGLRD
jgi:hypothetical protein